MGMREWGFAYGIINLLKMANKKGKVKHMADAIDKVIDQKFPKRSENIQRELVKEILLPLIKELLKENPLLLIQTAQKFVFDLNKQYRIKDVSFQRNKNKGRRI